MKCNLMLIVELSSGQNCTSFKPINSLKINPTSAAMFAKRGNCYIKMKRPNACIRDCTRAIELNPDNAAAYKFRGRANR